jgi:SAM-dependent methyltransferase
MHEHTPSEMDISHLGIIRENVERAIQLWASSHDAEEKRLLDIAPQDYRGARQFWTRCRVETLDIDPSARADYTADICSDTGIPANSFDFILCTEVLEHTLQPFDAVAEMHRLLRPGGLLLLSVPFNFRIHGPLPDCWRFTEHGIRALLGAGRFDEIQIDEVATLDRALMPIHYTASARKTAGPDTKANRGNA